MLLPNGNDGVLIGGTAHGNTIGGFYVSVIPENTFSGNGAYGLAIVGGANNNQVFANFIGTNVLGTFALGNGLGGVYVAGPATNNLIGGVTTNPSQPQSNLISGNTGNGVTLGPGSSNISVINNYIGTDRFGLNTIPNTGLPIFVSPLSINPTVSGNITYRGRGCSRCRSHTERQPLQRASSTTPPSATATPAHCSGCSRSRNSTAASMTVAAGYNDEITAATATSVKWVPSA